MKHIFNLVLSSFVLFQVFLSDAYSTEFQAEQPRSPSAYWMQTPNVEERDKVWRERFIIRLIRTRDEINNRENFRNAGFKASSLNDIATYLNDDKVKESFSDHKRLTLRNFTYPALLSIETLLRSLYPYSIESDYVDNIPADPRVINFLTQLRNEEDERQERLYGDYVETPQLIHINPQEEEREERKEYRNHLESNVYKGF